MTEQQPLTEGAREVLRALLETYGSDPARWPVEKRVSYAHLLDENQFDAALTDAQFVDELLTLSTEPVAIDNLKNSIVTQFSASVQDRKIFPWLGDLGHLLNWSRLIPAGVLASMGGIGFIVGTLASDIDTLPPEYEAYAYLEVDALTDLVDEEGALWDVD